MRWRYLAAMSLHDLLTTWPWRRKPVLVFGEPGLEKSNIAALVHFGSPAHAAPLVQARSRNSPIKACMPHLTDNVI